MTHETNSVSSPLLIRFERCYNEMSRAGRGRWKALVLTYRDRGGGAASCCRYDRNAVLADYS